MFRPTCDHIGLQPILCDEEHKQDPKQGYRQTLCQTYYPIISFFMNVLRDARVITCKSNMYTSVKVPSPYEH